MTRASWNFKNDSEIFNINHSIKSQINLKPSDMIDLSTFAPPMIHRSLLRRIVIVFMKYFLGSEKRSEMYYKVCLTFANLIASFLNFNIF